MLIYIILIICADSFPGSMSVAGMWHIKSPDSQATLLGYKQKRGRVGEMAFSRTFSQHSQTSMAGLSNRHRRKRVICVYEEQVNINKEK